MSYHPSALLVSLALLTAGAVPLPAAPGANEAPGVTGQESTPSLAIPRFETPPVIDGSLDDPAWLKAAQAGEFIQYTPKQGQAFTEKTVAYIGYDAENLYVAFRAYDTEPGKVRAHLAARDHAFGDDWVMLGLDNQYATLGRSGFADALLGWTPSPGTAVYAGYDISFSRSSGLLRRTGETFFTKVSYLFRM